MDEVLAKLKCERLIFPAALLIFSALMTANLTYDEAWSLTFFSRLDAGKILTDVSLPNNHPLNTFFLKILSPLSISPVVLRLPSLLCGAAVPLLCGRLAHVWSIRNKNTALLCGALLGIFSMPVAVYSGLARGYVIQLFCLLLCVWAMTRVKTHPSGAAVLAALGGIGVVLSVPDGAIFLLPAGVGFLICASPEVRKSPGMWAAAAVIAVFGAVYYGVNFSALRSGQSWGREIRDVPGFLTFVREICAEVIFVPTLAAAAAACVNPPKRLFFPVLLFVPLMLAIFTNGGPARCYIYLSAALAVGGGVAMGEIVAERYGFFAALAVALVLGASSFLLQYRQWKMPDHVAVFEKVMEELPPDTLPVFRATAGFPIRFGADGELLNALNSRLLAGSFRKIAVFECPDGVFNGLGTDRGEKSLTTGHHGEAGSFGGLPCRIYETLPLSAGDAAERGGVMLLICPGGTRRTTTQGDFSGGLLLNPWLFTEGRMIVCPAVEALEHVSGGRIMRIGGAEK